MAIEGYYLMPHPPIVIPEIGRGQEKRISETSASMDRIGQEIAKLKPDTIILITPHGPMFRDAVGFSYADMIKGNLNRFGADVSMTLEIDKLLTEKICELAGEEEIPTIALTPSNLEKYGIDFELDHGSLVPLYFISKYYSDYKILHITYAPIPDIQLYRLGSLINKVVLEQGTRAVIVASGDLSHKLTKDGPYGFDPAGKKHDERLLGLLEAGDVRSIFDMDKALIENAAECGRRSILLMLGALDGSSFKGDLYSYEGPFGVGYGVARLVKGYGTESLVADLEAQALAKMTKKAQEQNPYVRLARQSLTTYLHTGALMKDLPDYVTDEMKEKRRGVFVSLKVNGDLRGCIGTIFPTTESLAHEIIRNAVEAGVRDPRFYAVKDHELAQISFSVDVLTEPEPAKKEDLDPKTYGIIVKADGRRGLLLPDLEGVDTIEDQIAIALQKAGIRADQDYKLSRFKVIRYIEE
ncbi:MAG: AmmeMemoRadiSam system protein A [Eubacteriales bacterium]|jgi:AmmeMemoRadiSam system protein A|nr:AmmeMemoRadiSam system protein A [Bacillota bacterium]